MIMTATAMMIPEASDDSAIGCHMPRASHSTTNVVTRSKTSQLTKRRAIKHQPTTSGAQGSFMQVYTRETCHPPEIQLNSSNYNSIVKSNRIPLTNNTTPGQANTIINPRLRKKTNRQFKKLQQKNLQQFQTRNEIGLFAKPEIEADEGDQVPTSNRISIDFDVKKQMY